MRHGGAIELVRRFVPLALLVLACVLWFEPPSGLVVLSTWQPPYRFEVPPSGRVEGQEWDALVRFLADPDAPEAPPSWVAHQSLDTWDRNEFYVETDDPRLAGLTFLPGTNRVDVATPVGTVPLSAVRLSPDGIFRDVPFDLKRPYWPSALASLVLAALLYLGLPRERLPADVLRHDRLAARLLPDLLGVLLSLPFFAIPVILVRHDPLLGGAWPVIPIMGFMGLFGVLILLVAAWYASTWMRIHPDRLEVATLREVNSLAFADIVSVSPATWRLPGWIKPALVMAGGWRGLAPALLLADRVAAILAFTLRSGQVVRFPVDAFPGVDRLIEALKAAGVPIGPEVAGATKTGPRT
jgi:hypothetical protein